MNSEQLKMFQDYNKHVTTLSTGSILMLVAFSDKLQNFGADFVFTKISITFFLISILIALYSQLILVGGPFFQTHTYKSQAHKSLRATFFLSWVAFTLGMIFLLIYSWNLQGNA